MTKFFTRPVLEDRQFVQNNDSVLTLSGDTDFVGVLRSKGIEIDGTASGGTADIGKVLSFNGTKIILDDIGGAGGVYTGATPSNITVGGIPAGTNLSGRTISSILEELLIDYLEPAFTSFSISFYPSTVEVGTTISGTRTFSWNTSNSGNVLANSVDILDISAGSSPLATGLANDGSESVPLTTNQLNSNNATQIWRIEGTNTQLNDFTRNLTVRANYFRFYGAVSTSVSNSAEVRALPESDFQSSNSQTFLLNTGNVLTKFIVALPPSRTISTVFDLDALNANITSIYVDQGIVQVLDAGGTLRDYRIYEANIGAPYTSNHRHEITTA